MCRYPRWFTTRPPGGSPAPARRRWTPARRASSPAGSARPSASAVSIATRARSPSSTATEVGSRSACGSRSGHAGSLPQGRFGRRQSVRRTSRGDGDPGPAPPVPPRVLGLVRRGHAARRAASLTGKRRRETFAENGGGPASAGRMADCRPHLFRGCPGPRRSGELSGGLTSPGGSERWGGWRSLPLRRAVDNPDRWGARSATVFALGGRSEVGPSGAFPQEHPPVGGRTSGEDSGGGARPEAVRPGRGAAARSPPGRR